MKQILRSHTPLAILVVAGILFAISLLLLPTSTTLVQGQSGNDDPVYKYASSTTKWIGKDITTTIIGPSSGRSYLEISNIGTTSTTVFCAVGENPALNSGIVIHASSTRTWGRTDSVPVGMVKCLALNASTTIAIVAK